MKNLTAITLLLFISLQSFAQIDYAPQTISVLGSSTMEIIPDKVIIKVVLQEVKSRDLKLNMVQARNAFTAVCKDIGLSEDEITINDLGGSAAFRRLGSWRSSKKVEVDETFAYHLTFTDFDKLEKFLNTIDRPYIRSLDLQSATHSKMTEYRKEVKKNALKAAMEKSQYLAETAGRTLGKALFIEENPDYNSYSRGSNGMYSNTSNTMTLNIDDSGYGKSRLQFNTINLRYEIKLISELN